MEKREERDVRSLTIKSFKALNLPLFFLSSFPFTPYSTSIQFGSIPKKNLLFLAFPTALATVSAFLPLYAVCHNASSRAATASFLLLIHSMSCSAVPAPVRPTTLLLKRVSRKTSVLWEKGGREGGREG